MSTQLAPSEELRCRYPGKRCENCRTTKRGGGLHRLCAFHRARANKNQWWVDQRKRERQRELQQPAELVVDPLLQPIEEDVKGFDDWVGELSPQDLAMLEQILLEDE